MAYWQTHSPHKAKHECFCFYGACANSRTPENATHRPDCLSHHKRHAEMAETEKATATKTKSCYAVTQNHRDRYKNNSAGFATRTIAN